jgi:SAM-dependent methyltransferase
VANDQSYAPLATAKPWNLVANGYDEFTRTMFAGFARRGCELLSLPAGARVIDVACGPGTASIPLAHAGHEVDAIDFSDGMLERLRAKLAPGGTHEGASIRARLMDGQQLEFDDACFDAGISMFGLMFFPDRRRGLSELRRVVKGGGRVCIASWPPLTQVPAWAWVFGAIALLNPASSEEPPPRELILADRESIVRELSGAGFVNVEVEAYDQSTPMPDDLEVFWNAMVASSAPIALIRDSMDELHWKEASARAVEHLRATMPQDLDGKFTMRALIASADRPRNRS